MEGRDVGVATETRGDGLVFPLQNVDYAFSVKKILLRWTQTHFHITTSRDEIVQTD